MSRIGKPIRPIIELQKNGSIVNIITTTVQNGNTINDAYRVEGWEVSPDDKASAIYIDGLFKGLGFFVSEHGKVLQVSNNVEIRDKNGNNVTFAYKGIIGQLLDASLYERGSSLKPSMMQTLIYCGLIGFAAFMAGMSYK